MNIYMRDKEDNLVIKDILSVDFDMGIEEKDNNKYKVRVNNNYYLEGEYDSKDEAEENMLRVAMQRDEVESDLRKYE